jgi:dTMP kinase
MSYKYICVEGTNGSGKTTVCNMLNQLMVGKQKPTILGKAIGSGNGGDYIRELIMQRDPKNKDMEIALVTISHLLASGFINNKIKHSNVIMDRGLPSFYVYQVIEEQINHAMGFGMNHFVLNENIPNPDFYIYCDIEPQVVADRLNKRVEEKLKNDEFLKQYSLEECQERIKFYQKYFNEQPCFTINTSGNLDSIKKQVEDVYYSIFNDVKVPYQVLGRDIPTNV